jgi:uncharacterized phage-associated protein
MAYPFRFDLKKTLQAAGVLLEEEHGKRMNYMRLLKLLYIADRESLKETHRPITGDRPIAMKRGPLPEETYQLVRAQHLAFPVWSRHFQKEHYQLAMLRSPGVAELSPYEVEKLQEVHRRYEDADEWELVEIAHAFPEWRKNDPGDSSRAIPIEDILEAQGCAHVLDDVLEEARSDAAAERLFGQPE